MEDVVFKRDALFWLLFDYECCDVSEKSVESGMLAGISVPRHSEIADPEMSVADHLAKCGLRISWKLADVAELVEKYEGVSEYVGDGFCFVVFFQVLWSCYRSGEEVDSEQFCMLMKCLTLCVRSKYLRDVSFCVCSLLSKALELPRFRWDNISMVGLLSHVKVNESLDVASCPLMIKLFGRILEGNECICFAPTEVLPMILDVWQVLVRRYSEDPSPSAGMFVYVLKERLLECLDFFVSDLFHPSCIGGLFEDDVEGCILDAFVASAGANTSRTHVSPFLLGIVEKAQQDSRCLDFTVQISHAMLCILRQSPRIAANFEPLFLPLLRDISRSCPDLTKNVMKLLRFLLNTDVMDDIDAHVFERLCQSIVPDEDFLCLLKALLCSYVDSLWIECPFFLELLVTVYYQSDLFLDVVEYLTCLALHSHYNRRKLHECDIDVFLLHVLSGAGVFLYHGVQLQNRACDRTSIVTLLTHICADSCNSDITTQVVMYFGDSQQEPDVILNMLERCDRNSYPLGSIGPFYEGILQNPDDFNRDFVVEFELKLDLPILLKTNACITLVSITDGKQNHLSLFVNGHTLYIQSDNHSVPLSQNLSSGKWKSAKAAFMRSDDGLNVLFEISQYTSTATVKPPHFVGSLSVTFGGLKHSPHAKVSDVTMGRMASISIKADNTREMLSHRHFKHIDCERTILDCFAHDFECVRTLLRVGKLSDKTLMCLKIILTQSKVAENNFKCDEDFVQLVTNSHVDFHLYLMLHSVSCVIKNESLKSQWLRNILVNIGIWSHCTCSDLQKIMNHWTALLLRQNRTRFAVESYFSSVLDHVSLFLNNSFSYCEKEKEQLRDMFLNFVKRISLAHISASDVRNLLTLCKSSDDVEAKACYVRVIRDCAKLLLTAQPRDVDVVRTVISLTFDGSPRVVSMALQALHELDSVLTHNYPILFPMSERQDKELVLMELVPVLGTYPNLASIASYLSLDLANPNSVVPQLVAALSSPRFIETDFWYLWPVILCRKLDKNNQQKIIDGIVSVLHAHGLVQDEVSSMFHFLSLLTVGGDRDLPFCLLRSINIRTGMLDSVFVQYCFLNCARTLFFRVSESSHSSRLLKAFRESPFHTRQLRLVGSHQLETVEELLYVDVGSFNLVYDIQTDELDEVIDKDKAKWALALGLYVDEKCTDLQMIRNVITYFSKKDQAAPNTNWTMWSQFDAVFTRMRAQYEEEFRKSNAKTLSKLREYVATMNRCASAMK